MDETYTKVLVKGTSELVDCWGHLELLLEDAALALDAHDPGPLPEAVEVLLRRQRAPDPKLLWPFLEQRVGHFLLHIYQQKAPCTRSNQERTKQTKTSRLGKRFQEFVAYGLLLRWNRRLDATLGGL